MDDLPLELVLELGKHLAAPDLVSCCAVSRHCRSIFNQDVLWKRHCRQDLAEYLRTTSCIVEPVFVSPEPESSTLDPICDWWLAYMRENHLWNNWRTGNYKSEVFLNRLYEECRVVIPPSQSDRVQYDWNFHADVFRDYLALLYEERIELWDMTADPAVRISVSKYYLPSFVFKSFKCVGKNLDIIVFNYLTGTQVFRLNEVTKNIELQHMFYFDEDEELLIHTESQARAMFEFQHMHPLPSIAIVGSLYLGVIRGTSRNLHVWDLETGKKLKEEPCPRDIPNSFIQIGSSSTSEDVILVVTQVGRGRVNRRMSDVQSGESIDVLDYHFYIYSPKRLTFLPFTKSCNACRGYACAIHRQYVAICEGIDLNIFNYAKSELIYTMTIFLTGIDVVDNGIVFVDRSRFRLFNPSVNPPARELTLHNVELLYFKLICGNFLLFRKDEMGVPTELWEAGRVLRRTRTELPKESDTTRANKTCTKLVVKEDIMVDRRLVVTIRHFW
uniref:F-box domain-containing protein n=1 Tax=Homalodisca liturata TaxID=320908 RepID=A0A1B6J3R3_9HEMI